MVERVTSNDEVAGSIPSEGIQAHLQALNFLHFFGVEWWLNRLVRRGKFLHFFWGAVSTT